VSLLGGVAEAELEGTFLVACESGLEAELDSVVGTTIESTAGSGCAQTAPLLRTLRLPTQPTPRFSAIRQAETPRELKFSKEC